MKTENGNQSILWENETDWLVEVVFGVTMSGEDTEILDWIGRLAAFAIVTNTRSLAQIGSDDPDFPEYELWFSFDSEENRQRFLEFVRQDGYANPDEQDSFKPPTSLADLCNLRPLTKVFPRAQADHIRAVTVATAIGLGVDASNSDA